MLRSVVRVVVLGVALTMVAPTAPASAAQPGGPTITKTPAKKPPKPTVKKSTKIIVSPKRGAKVRTHALRIKVKAKRGIYTGKLNRTRLRTSDFRWQKGPYYVLDASASHGLRHKSNTLRVVVLNAKGGLSKQQIRFSIRHTKPLTGAGRDITVRAGSSVTLPGQVRVLNAKGRKTSAAPSMSWRIVRAPGKKAVLDPTAGTTATLTTTKPGSYLLKAVGSHEGVRTNDTVRATVVEAPSVQFESFASTGGGPGIRIGGTVHQVYAPLDKAQWQVLIANRRTGAVQPGYNYTYGVCPDNAQAICRWNSGGRVLKSPQEDLKDLDSSLMAIAVHHGQFGGGLGTAATYFAKIGVPKKFDPSGPTALIGLGDAEPGDARRVVNSSRGMQGTLQWDTHKNYVYVSSDRTTFDSRAGGGCGPDTCTVTMEVGGVPRTYSVPATGAGFALQSVDRTSLQVRDGRAFDLSGAPASVTEQVQAMTAWLEGQPDGALIMIASLGSPDRARMNQPGIRTKFYPNCWLSGLICVPYMDFYDQPVVSDLASAIAELGGSRHAFLQSTRKAGDNYSLVGWKGLEQGQASQVHSAKGRLSGAFVRGVNDLFVTANVTEDDEAQELLTSLTTQVPDPNGWPQANNAVYQKALDDIGTRVAIGADPRSAWWARDEALDNGNPKFWSDLAPKVYALTPPTDWSAADVATWKQAQSDLTTELVWVGGVRQYFDWLQHPYGAKNQLKTWVDANNVASRLKTSDDWAKNQKVNIDWLDVFATLIEAIAPFAGFAPETAEKAIHIFAGLVAAALEYAAMGTANTEAGQRITEQDEQDVEALNVETEVLTHMQDAAAAFDQMADNITSDYAKLKALGTKAACYLVDPKTGKPLGQCEPGFAPLSNDDFDNMSVTALRTAERTVYEKLLPVAWPVTRIPAGGKLSGDGFPEGNWDAKRYECSSASLFSNLPDRANIFTMKDVKYRYSDHGSLPGFRTPRFEVYVIGEINSRNNVVTPSDTKNGDKTILGRMFKPMSASFNETDGGLGIDPAEFMVDVENEARVKDYDLYCGGWDYSDNNTPAPVN